MIRFSHVYQPYGSYTAFGIPLSSIKYPVRFRLASECDPTGYRMQGNQRPDASPKTSIKKMRGAGRQFSGTSLHTAHNAIITCIHHNKNRIKHSYKYIRECKARRQRATYDVYGMPSCSYYHISMAYRLA